MHRPICGSVPQLVATVPPVALQIPMEEIEVKSWGYPQSSSIVDWSFPLIIDHPFGGYPQLWKPSKSLINWKTWCSLVDSESLYTKLARNQLVSAGPPLVRPMSSATWNLLPKEMTQKTSHLSRLMILPPYGTFFHCLVRLPEGHPNPNSAYPAIYGGVPRLRGTPRSSS